MWRLCFLFLLLYAREAARAISAFFLLLFFPFFFGPLLRDGLDRMGCVPDCFSVCTYIRRQHYGFFLFLFFSLPASLPSPRKLLRTDVPFFFCALLVWRTDACCLMDLFGFLFMAMKGSARIDNPVPPPSHTRNQLPGPPFFLHQSPIVID